MHEGRISLLTRYLTLRMIMQPSASASSKKFLMHQVKGRGGGQRHREVNELFLSRASGLST